MIEDFGETIILIENVLSCDKFKILDHFVDQGVLKSEYLVIYGINNGNYEMIERYGKSSDNLYTIFDEYIGDYNDIKLFKYMLDTNYNKMDEFVDYYGDGFEDLFRYETDFDTITRLIQKYPYLRMYLSEEQKKEYDSRTVGAIAPTFKGKLPPNVVDNILRQAGYDSLSLYESMQILQPILQPESRIGAREFKEYESPDNV